MTPTDIHSLKAFVFDMDGVLYAGTQRLPGAAELLNALQQKNFPFICLTNNSTATPRKVAERLKPMGIDVDAAHILTSSLVAATHLKQLRPDGARVFVIGEDGLREPVHDAGFTLADEGPADFVVLGMDRTITYDKLKRATLLIRAGTPFIATNPDPTYPTPEGLVPGCGSLIAALQATTSVSPLIIGKPEPAGFQLALKLLGTDADHTAAIGDRLDTDILGGQRAGLHTVLVLTGVTQRDELPHFPIQPDWVFNDLVELQRAVFQGLVDHEMLKADL
jgi:4-nitrophenyl phosphatase